MEGVNPGNIYVDNQSIKEDVDNPYTILLFSGSMPTVDVYKRQVLRGPESVGVDPKSGDLSMSRLKLP